jgi:parvulin-like peptidyl-prolyl isomerase
MKRTIIFLTLLFLLVLPVFAQSFDLRTVAIVNLIRSEPISGRDLRNEVELVERTSGRTLTPAQRQGVLDEMINERLAIQAAERDRVTVTENEVNQHMQQLRGILQQSMGRQPTEAEFAQAIRNEFGMELPAYRERIRRQMIVQKYLMSQKESLISTIRPPTAEEIQREFNLRRAEFIRPETVEFVAIQISFGQDAASRTRARERGEQMLREIGSNISIFDRKVDEASMPNSGYQAGAGALPRIPEAQREFGQDFINVAFNLRQGEVSRLIETPVSYVIMKVTRNLDFRTLELDDIVPTHLLMRAGVDPRVNVSVRNFLQNLLFAQNQQAVLTQASQELVTELRAGRSFQILETNLNW